jgi:uncharacterized coiled-coil protein SlyX
MWGASPSNNREHRSLEKRIAQLEKKLKKQESNMAKYLAKYLAQESTPRRPKQSPVDLKKEFEQAVWRFCEEQKRTDTQVFFSILYSYFFI